MFPGMVAALVSALAVVIAALISLWGTRMAASDRRDRLSNDVETLGNLKEGSVEYLALERHVRASVLELIRADQDWPMMRQFLTVGAVGFCSLALALGFYIPLTLYDLGQFRSSFQIQAWAWGVMGFALLPWLIVLLVRIARDSRKRLKQMREDLQLMRDELAARNS